MTTEKMKRVVIESPLSGDFRRNIRYAKLCAIDCLRRGEAPYASHLLMTQILDDAAPEDRKLGMEVGFVWGECAAYVVVYIDLGVSGGMRLGVERHRANNIECYERRLPPDLMVQLDASDVPVIRPTEGIE